MSLYSRDSPTSCENNVCGPWQTNKERPGKKSRAGRISGVLSTQPNLTPQWKEEVNRRIAAHKSRKSGSGHDIAPQQASAATSRAAQAAARVAARYAKAPTYSQMQAEEVRAAVRAAEIATRVALEAQATAENALAELHAASIEKSRAPVIVKDIEQTQRKHDAETRARTVSEPSLVEPATPEGPTAVHPAAPAAPEIRYQQPFAIRWDPDMPSRPSEQKPAPRVHDEFVLAAEDWWSPAEVGSALRNEPLEVVSSESSQANLIQFPRELVATRKIRPRLAETCYGTLTEAEGQLSIFEVDPLSIATEVPVPSPFTESPASSPNVPGWSGIQLEAHPAQQPGAASSAESRIITHLAPLGLRLMATVIDCALILAAFVLAGFAAAGSFHHPPTGKSAELIGMLALVTIGLGYYSAFFSLGMSTPGMKYAGIGLCTFDDKSPTRAQLQRRLGAMALSILPVGLGVVWSVFDDDHLSWHDRISQTYLRKC
jgi:uncharacterized RDD family membrane protein YckC